MKNRPHKSTGFTLEELLIVIATVGILAALLVTFLPRKNRHPDRGRMRCWSNQKMIGTSFRVFAADNDDRYPLQTTNHSFIVPGSPTAGQVTASSAAAWQVAQAMWNELQAPKVLLCPDDRERTIPTRATVTDFSGLAGNTNAMNPGGLGHPANQNAVLSYAFGVAADESRPLGVLLMDRNVNNVGVAKAGALGSVALTNTRPVLDATAGPTQTVWVKGSAIHGIHGNLAFADGSVQQSTAEMLRQALADAAKSYGTVTNQNQLLFP